ncbi:MAG: radical SAM protein [Nitrospirae bacterium]|nr:MAG: radical SAM protein [Nitrospirota bacterium]
MSSAQTFRLVLIKPSHYDDDGYVIQWVRSSIPSNTLAVLYGLALDCAQRQVLGKNVEIIVDPYDETNTVIPVKRIIRAIKRAGRGMVGLVGVQSNQFPHAVDLADRFIAAGIPVVIGGFHVSGCLAMLPKIPPDIQAAIDKGITIFAGEAEEHLADILRDAYHGRLKPIYNYMDYLPDLSHAPSPYLPAPIINKTLRRLSSFDAGRGCPFQCSFCTIINVQGRKSRWRSADDIEALIRRNLAQGVRRFFITDDDFARNKDWEAILDRCIAMREQEHLPISFTIQVDTMCHKIPRFIEKCARAGARNVFIGLENINPDSLVGAKKRQNKIWEYRKMIQAWKDHGCTTVAGYILGFPTDTPESIARDIEIIKKELPLDCLEFFCLTPLPGSEDHKRLYEQGVWMDPDMNNYDLEHVTMAHPRMSKETWQQTYRQAWQQYYTLDHVETVIRRAAAKGQNINKVTSFLTWFYGCMTIEGIHPLEAGIFRRKVRTMRRSGLPLEHPLVFYPKRVWEVLESGVRWGWLIWQHQRILKRVKRDPARRTYMDHALAPVLEHEDEDSDLIKTYVDRIPLAHLTKTKATMPH